jgi:CBS domain containing-hemolysin-like protein
MPDRLAKDIMIPLSEYAAVNVTDSLKDAIRILKESLPIGHRTLAVLDDKGDLAGFLTTRTILKALGVYGIDEDAWNRIAWGTFFSRIEKNRLKYQGLSKIMRPVVNIFVHEDSSLHEVTQVILKNQINHIPVYNKQKKVTGIIRTIDILDTLADLLDIQNQK